MVHYSWTGFWCGTNVLQLRMTGHRLQHNSAFDWTRPGWCGREEEVVEQMKMTASCPPRPGRWKTDETLLLGNHCQLILYRSSTEDTSLTSQSHTGVFTTNKAEQIRVFQVCSPPVNMSSICGKAA